MTEAQPIEITPDLTMQEILERAPSAQRALFQRYHVGGCSSCGFQPTDTLAQVCKDHNLLDVSDVVNTILRSHEADVRIQVEPRTVRDWQVASKEFALIDVRTPPEFEQGHVAGSELLDYTNSQRYMELPKSTKLVFVCRDGDRSLDVASYFIGHGFTDVWSVKGGVEAWREQVDPSISVA